MRGADKTARKVIEFLEDGAGDQWDRIYEVRRSAAVDTLAEALRMPAKEETHESICIVLAHREQGDSARAVPVLLDLLDTAPDGLAQEAAEALANIVWGEGAAATLAAAPDAGTRLESALRARSETFLLKRGDLGRALEELSRTAPS